MSAPLILCPVDFSDASRSALLYAAAVGNHFGSRLHVLTAVDPLLTQAAALHGQADMLVDETLEELRHFAADALSAVPGGPMSVTYEVCTEKAASAIVRRASELSVDLIVISSHGLSGLRKLFIGSTTERVLRETSVPVLIAPPEGRVVSLGNMVSRVGRVLAPVDFSDGSRRQVAIATALARAISCPLILSHVIEPVFVPNRARRLLPGSDATRREEAVEQLRQLASACAVPEAEQLVTSGDAAEEIVRLATARRVGLIVIGLHGTGAFGPRMGSVTYRILCTTHTLVLALPPSAVSSPTLGAAAGEAIV